MGLLLAHQHQSATDHPEGRVGIEDRDIAAVRYRGRLLGGDEVIAAGDVGFHHVTDVLTDVRGDNRRLVMPEVHRVLLP